jgi:hypothetical protein
MSDDEFNQLADGSWKYEIEALRARVKELDFELQPKHINPIILTQIVDQQEEIANLRARVKELESMVISGFYEDEIPSFQQGIPTHELQDVVTADEVRGYVAMIVELRKQK